MLHYLWMLETRTKFISMIRWKIKTAQNSMVFFFNACYLISEKNECLSIFVYQLRLCGYANICVSSIREKKQEENAWQQSCL